MKSIGFFREMYLYVDVGSIKDYLVENIDYDKKKVIDYLKNQKRIAGCPRSAIDCLTGKEIARSFFVYSDGEYEWCDFLVYHIEHYNIRLPKEFIDKIEVAQ